MKMSLMWNRSKSQYEATKRGKVLFSSASAEFSYQSQFMKQKVSLYIL